MLTRVTAIAIARTHIYHIHCQGSLRRLTTSTSQICGTGLARVQSVKPNTTRSTSPPNVSVLNHRKNHTSSSKYPSTSTTTTTDTTMLNTDTPTPSNPDPVVLGTKRSLPIDEGATSTSGTGVQTFESTSEQIKRVRVDAAASTSEENTMIVDNAATTPPQEEGEAEGSGKGKRKEEDGGEGGASDSGSDVIITEQNAIDNTPGKDKGKNKSRGKGRRRRADDWNKEKKKDKDGGEGKDNRRNRGRAPPPSRPGTGLTRNEEDALKKELGEGGGEGQEEGVKSIRYPKRQCAVLLGFCGSGYSGMQIQPDHTRTIEGVLFTALVRAGAVSQDNADNPTKVNLARAARTDAGVHAAGNVVSLKMITKPPGVKDLVERINQELPPEIRVWGYARTQNSFNARLVCESRKYTYFFPTYLLIPPKPGSGMHRVWSELVTTFPSSETTLTTATITETSSETTSTTTTTTNPLSYEFWDSHPEGSTKEEDLARKRAWRIRPSQVSTLREAASKYLGTHNFHNFTVGREFKDRSNNRFMRKIEVSDPVVYGETEWISVLFHGQSFMLHQRKMMAALVLSCRMGTPAKVIDELYTEREVFVPKMPSLGLLLEEPLFDSYNQRMGAINAKLTPSDPEYRPLIDFDVHREKIDAFKDEFIYQNMRKVEDRDGLFDAWVRYIDAYAGNDLLYLNPAGIIPDESVVKRGEKRTNPFKEKRVFDTTSFPEKGIKQRLEGAVDGDGDADMEGSEEEEEEVLDKRHLAETEG